MLDDRDEREAERADVARLLGYDPCANGQPLPEKCRLHGTFWPHAGDLMPECPACLLSDMEHRPHFRDMYFDRY